jgi:alpha-mannosidase
VELAWDSQSEATVWADGVPIGALNDAGPDNPARRFLRLTDAAQPGRAWDLRIEMACNGIVGLPRGGEAPARQRFALGRCDLVRVDPEAWSMWHDFRVLRELSEEVDPPQTSKSFTTKTPLVRPGIDPAWAGRLLGELNRFANTLDPHDRATWPAARRILAGLLTSNNGTVAHELSAIGHAHIDTAWLWPIEETHRKCVRTFANVLGLMDRYPTLRFACSQAYQYDVIERERPGLFERIHRRVDEGRWIPVGGMWVEPDCNLPSGESLCRQLLYGQRHFERRFGARSRLGWLPDVFGYPAQLPQILRHAGIDRFLTQKLSWNAFTPPTHHTFVWRGLDGTETLTHFPPADTYNARCSVEELRYHAANYKDADRSSEALYLFGYGDGGGGPDDAMLETLERVRDLQGVPRCDVRTPDAFFDRLEADARQLPVVTGELYLELHRGTFTTQARTKRLNRLCERALHDLELCRAMALVDGRAERDREAVGDLWRTVCLHQFHDDLPGSSIPEVYERTERELGEVLDEARARTRALAGDGGALLNTTSFARTEIVEDGGSLRAVRAEPFGVAEACEPEGIVDLAEREDGRFFLRNDHMEVILSPAGEVLRMYHPQSMDARDALMGGPGVAWRLLDDRPTFWEAWDIDPFALETARTVDTPATSEIVTRTPERVEIRFDRPLGRASRMSVSARLDAGARRLELRHRIDWRERKTMLRLVASTGPVNARATYETQYGAVERPTTMNNPIELARYEVPAQRWADLSAPGAGLAILNDCKHGHAAFGGGLSVTLLRSTGDPDPEADQGEHEFTIALMPHAGDWRAAGVVAEAAALNAPLIPAGAGGAPLLRIHRHTRNGRPVGEGVVVDTVKPAEDADDVVVRLYEAHGSHASITLTPAFDVASYRESNTLEDDLRELEKNTDGSVGLAFRPFELRTIILRRGG